jgi:hypothetical protein
MLLISITNFRTYISDSNCDAFVVIKIEDIKLKKAQLSPRM